MAQTALHQDPSVPVLLDGPFGDYGAFVDVVHGNHRGRVMTLGLTVPMRKDSTKGDRSASLVTEFKYRLQRREIVIKSSRLSIDDSPQLDMVRPTNGERLNLRGVSGVSVPPEARGQFGDALRTNGFVPNVNLFALESRIRRAQSTARIADVLRSSSRDVRRASESISSALRRVEVIGAMRQPPLRTYLHSGAVGRHIGVAGENWGALIATASSARGRSTSFLRDVKRWMKKAGIASDVKIRWLSDRHFEVVVEHPMTHELENVSDVGRGTSQVLPVIIAGYRLSRDSTFLVEEPEIHLHPRAQASLGDFFVDMTKRGVQSVVETHSEYLIMRLQQHIASGRLSPEDVLFYYVDASGESKRIRSLELDENATFSDGIPGGFFPQRLSEASQLVKARGGRRN